MGKHKGNKIGPRIKPRGTPHVIEAEEETLSLTETENLSSDKYDKRHHKFVS